MSKLNKIVFLQIFALLPWADIMDLARRVGLDPLDETSDPDHDVLTGMDELGMETHCNPKFPKTCG